MRVQEIADKLEARILAVGDLARAEIARAWAGDRISDLLNQASNSTLVLTHAVSPHLVRVAELVDLAAVCVVGGQAPGEDFPGPGPRGGPVGDRVPGRLVRDLRPALPAPRLPGARAAMSEGWSTPSRAVTTTAAAEPPATSKSASSAWAWSRSRSGAPWWRPTRPR
ncbi:MAG: hypothetical protein MZU79_02360 [Anaerotruncus sp.]|nr:hypothetical protein [Anaerotruncus sp.]